MLDPIPSGGIYKVFNLYYRNVTKFHICGHTGDKIAVPAENECYTLPDACYWICSEACDRKFADKSCAQIFAKAAPSTDETVHTAFVRKVYGIWRKYFERLQENHVSLSGYELLVFRVALKGWKAGEWEKKMELQIQMERERRMQSENWDTQM